MAFNKKMATKIYPEATHLTDGGDYVNKMFSCTLLNKKKQILMNNLVENKCLCQLFSERVTDFV